MFRKIDDNHGGERSVGKGGSVSAAKQTGGKLLGRSLRNERRSPVTWGGKVGWGKSLN